MAGEPEHDRWITNAFRLGVILLAFLLGAVVALELTDRAIIVEEVPVPAELSDRGYSPSMVANRILSEWDHVDRTATTRKRRREISLRRGEVAVSVTGLDFSISSMVDYVRTRLNFPQERLRGGIVRVRSPGPECVGDCYVFHLRLNGRPSFSVARPVDDVDGLIRAAAREAVQRLDPYLLANFYFASEEVEEPNRRDEVKRLVEVVLSEDPKDDDHWALTLRGVVLHEEGHPSDAIRDFDDALALNRQFAPALNSRCWARAHRPNGASAAIEDCWRSLYIDQTSFEAWHSLSYALEQFGDTEGAFGSIKCAQRVAEEESDIDDANKAHRQLLARLPSADRTVASRGECTALLSRVARTYRQAR